jgi:hypothetical protein
MDRNVWKSYSKHYKRSCQKKDSFSLRDTYRDVGGRAKHGAIAEKVRMRGYKSRRTICHSGGACAGLDPVAGIHKQVE